MQAASPAATLRGDTRPGRGLAALVLDYTPSISDCPIKPPKGYVRQPKTEGQCCSGGIRPRYSRGRDIARNLEREHAAAIVRRPGSIAHRRTVWPNGLSFACRHQVACYAGRLWGKERVAVNSIAGRNGLSTPDTLGGPSKNTGRSAGCGNGTGGGGGNPDPHHRSPALAPALGSSRPASASVSDGGGAEAVPEAGHSS